MAIKRTGRVDSNIESIERALEGMLANLTAELEAVVSSGTVDKSKLEGILAKIDDQIINNASVRSYMLGDDPATQTRVKNLIQEVQDAVKETIEEFRDSNKGKVLSDDQYKEVMGVYDAKVTGSATVTRSKVLDEFRSKANSITFDSTEKRLSSTDRELIQITDKLNKLTAIKALMQPGETLEVALARLSKDAGKINLDGEKYYAKIDDITKPVDEGGYDYESAAAKIAVGNFMYKNNPENCKLVSEFLNNLVNLREGNPEIESILAELAAAGIKPGKDGKYQIKQAMSESLRKKISDALNKKLMAKPIDFKKARENTANVYSEKIDAEITSMLSSDIMKLYPEEVKKWAEMLDKANKENNVSMKDDIWYEMEKFLSEHDIAVEILDVKDFEDESTLTTRKAELEGKKKVLSNRAEGERLEKLDDTLTQIQVLGIDIKSKRDLVGLTPEEMDKASSVFYEDKMAEFEAQFDKLADPKLKKIGFFEKLGYAISHRTIHPGQAIKAERVEAWARKQIAATVSAEAQKIVANKTEKGIRYELGALTPEQLKEFNERQTEFLAKHKKEQEEAILAGTTKTADDATKNAKDDTEMELE